MVLTAGGITLPLVDSPMGPLIATGNESTDPLAWALNLGTGAISLAESIRAGRTIAGPEVRIGPLADDDDRAALAAGWRALGGLDLGDDAWLISIGFLPRPLAVPRAVLLELADELDRLRAEAPKPPGPWLFRADPQWHEPAAGEDSELRPLEQRAARADRADPAERPALLRALDQHGIFADAWWDERAVWLDRWGLPTLAGYSRAARELHRYLRSHERRRHIDDAGPQPVLGAPVSVDWFRHPWVPPGVEPFDWLGSCERALRDAPSTAGDGGEVFTRVGGAWYRIGWRRDDGSAPAIVETSAEEDSS